MLNNIKTKSSYIFYLSCVVAFAGAVAAAQFVSLPVIISVFLLLIGVAAAVSNVQVKQGAAMTAAIMIGFPCYMKLSDYIQVTLNESHEWSIIVSRAGLIGLLVPIILVQIGFKLHRQWLAPGSFAGPVYFPFILKGYIKDPVWRFLIIFTVITIFSFVWFIDWRKDTLGQLLLYGIAFGLINGILEEILWRGYVLSGFTGMFGEIKGIFIAGTGFGFYHFHLGFGWEICLLFAVFGWMMSALAVQSKGLLPVIIMHIIMNILFVLSGMIF
ncbi:CPBP family intramembrane glutamic endopeptidase [Paenibacillus lemnae]|uniref:CPBP family intramembrane metalloprotease n=1 Tax=Paenibacillus lemnae TaxID=1330551 RepID=A0A848M9S6_PAELE|nr:CPBP family intramembrane glutamic endopeptidase [Paenibacillus lemnae]NMO97998.1 CPBP family intramembrane metalloprotease [Paenibacillus lemnae]